MAKRKAASRKTARAKASQRQPDARGRGKENRLRHGRLRAKPPRRRPPKEGQGQRSQDRPRPRFDERSQPRDRAWCQKGKSRRPLAKKRAGQSRQAKAATPSRLERARLRPPVKRTAPRAAARPAGAHRTRSRIASGGRSRDDDIVPPTPPSSLDLDRTASAARSGRRELLERYAEHTETSPALTGGDVDADWESAYSVGDEAPGGDNPTPDQDIVDDIGRAVGVAVSGQRGAQGREEAPRARQASLGARPGVVRRLGRSLTRAVRRDDGAEVRGQSERRSARLDRRTRRSPRTVAP